ncbi:MAG: hypothetical protein A3H01_02215 [Candidatus Wildermuthbacteria bacterium RIFCSPLOWO2_12_FULL_40_9]|uniref:DUF6938 domain-containing protein n=2 Tax=Candidatus Wildermuthiibacteriota TaxID=1817923 RepID=A0A1G2REH9_9BACT|nr:MAG: hypothetical protein A3F15_00850 [Candidatus Wildermuthbacteria bacterium RIFCSPHIGHO2_12_FULL_40_12]OHA76219.1 MAG: hypothetical protein A3H01_02215 [Candidatus Wildermuthbacteria bacterium RIFCSPLOWO2_12_FULL_40_9]
MEQKSWIISVNMGYGHQRTAFPLRELALGGDIINANNYQGIPRQDRNIWESTRTLYEAIAGFYRIPLIGKPIFGIFDKFQKIFDFYPKRDLSRPNFQLKQIISIIKSGWGRHLIQKLKIENEALKRNPPIITTFFTTAFMAEIFDYPGDIFCIVCDADISRTWAPLNPKISKIKYFAPTERVMERLMLYGVNPDNIIFSGYPLPVKNIGNEQMEILKEDLRQRILNLDPQKKYFEKYGNLIKANLGELPNSSRRQLTIMFSVGGAGAQREIGISIIRSLNQKIRSGLVKVVLSAGIKEKVKIYFEKAISALNFHQGVEILFENDIENYFRKFNSILRKTDILWTKPSELSFYSALGIPIIVSPPIGSQEEFNKRWLLKSGFGLTQENPKFTSQWLFDWLDKGYLAEAAMEGFVEGEKLGTLKIKEVITK